MGIIIEEENFDMRSYKADSLLKSLTDIIDLYRELQKLGMQYRQDKKLGHKAEELDCFVWSEGLKDISFKFIVQNRLYRKLGWLQESPVQGPSTENP